MTVRADVAELLQAGYGDRTIARQTGYPIPAIARGRARLGIPKCKPGRKPAATPEDLFWRRAQPVDDGHMQWNGYRTGNGTPGLRHGGIFHTAYRIAYRIQYGTDPIGYVRLTCDQPGCVAPAHMADTRTVPGRGHPNASRDQILTHLRAGLTDQAIGLLLRVDPKRVASIRAAEGVERPVRRRATFAEKWAANTVPTPDGHVLWTGRCRDGTTPSLVHRGRDYSARRAAFEELHHRPAQGLVKPGCGREDCVRPDHLEDRPMRAALRTQLASIFGSAA